MSQDSISDTETPKRTVERQGSIPPSSPISVGGRSDAESDAEQSGTPGTPGARLDGATKEEVVARVLARYKTRFSEVSHFVTSLFLHDFKGFQFQSN